MQHRSSLDRPEGQLVLSDGTRFRGRLIGGGQLPVWGEVVFNTSMTGYQEVVSDPSYAGQIVVMTYPQIGNYGVHDGDNERAQCAARALVVRDLSTYYSPGPGRGHLEGFMSDNGMAGLTDVDTRALTLRIRSEGAVVGVIGSAEHSAHDLSELAHSKEIERERNLVAGVTCKERVQFTGTSGRVAVVDYGAKQSILDAVKRVGADTVIFDAGVSPPEILDGSFDCLVLSNGPGDPTDVPHAIETTSRLIGRVPILGICLGHQITALALGGRTYKLKFGHRGANQPVLSHRTKRVFMTSQNHGYAVSEDLAEIAGVDITYTNLNDGTVEGFAHEDMNIECVQFHPEASPGPHDTSFVFEEFFHRVKGRNDAQPQ